MLTDRPEILHQLCDLLLDEARQVSQRTRDRMEELRKHYRNHTQAPCPTGIERERRPPDEASPDPGEEW
jgi:hypothetical protein